MKPLAQELVTQHFSVNNENYDDGDNFVHDLKRIISNDLTEK